MRLSAPIWPRIISCPLCKVSPEHHGGQRGGVRRYVCKECLNTWNEPPIGWHIISEAGEESVVSADLINAAVSPNLGNHDGRALG